MRRARRSAGRTASRRSGTSCGSIFFRRAPDLQPSPANVALMRLANAVLMGVGAAMMVAHLAPRIPVRRWIVAAGVVLAATAVPMVAVATVLFSEPLFLVIATAALWAADAACAGEE